LPADSCLHWANTGTDIGMILEAPRALRICWLSNKTRRIKLFQIYRDKGVLQKWSMYFCVYIPRLSLAAGDFINPAEIEENQPPKAKQKLLRMLCHRPSVSVYLGIYAVSQVERGHIFSHRFVPQNDRPTTINGHHPKRTARFVNVSNTQNDILTRSSG